MSVVSAGGVGYGCRQEGEMWVWVGVKVWILVTATGCQDVNG